MARRWLPDLLIALAIFALCLGVYNATLTPSLSYVSPDGNELATVPYILGLAHSTGYPLYTWLGKLFTFLPIGDVAHRVNLMSATLGAAGVALLYAILRLLTSDFGRRMPSTLASAFAALLFGFSRTFWSQTTIAEVYAPNVFMVALTVLLLLLWARGEERDRAARSALRGWRRLIPSRRSLLLLAAFGLAFGLSLGTHMSDLGFAPAFALFILLVSPWTALSPLAIGSAGAGFLAGLLQYLWLPLRASTLLDQPMRANAPVTLQGMYNYTLGAFPQFRFAFPLTALPDRIVIYLYFLFQQFGFIGILGGIVGMWVLLFRRPRHFFLLIGMYAVHVWFFIQYNAFDLDVFFIPAHLVYAVFIGCAVAWLLERLAKLRRPAVARALTALAALLLVVGLAGEVWVNWPLNDRSGDMAINDFYENVFALLPQDAVLLSRGGVFGYDVFYYRLVYGVRPDVLIPALDPAPPTGREGREVYANTTLEQARGGGGGGGPWAAPRGWTEADDWAVPVLHGASGAAGSRELVLYHVTDEPPELVVTDAHPQHPVGQPVGGRVLLGYDLETESVPAGGTLHLTLYWQGIEPLRGVLVGTALDGEVLEVHELGLGNLTRYVQTFRPPQDGVVVEDYRVVVPSQTAPGAVSLEVVAVNRFGAEGAQVVERLPLQSVTVQELTSCAGEDTMAAFMSNRLLIGVGAVVIVALLLIAAFSIGVYVGENGWTWRGVSLAGPGVRPNGPQAGGPPANPLPPGGAVQPPAGAVPGPALPARPPDLTGRVRALDGGILHLASPDGPRAVQVTDRTQVHTPEGEVAGLDALRREMIVAVFGHRGDGGQMLVADIVVILRP